MRAARKPGRCTWAGLGWAGLGWAGLGWAGLRRRGQRLCGWGAARPRCSSSRPPGRCTGEAAGACQHTVHGRAPTLCACVLWDPLPAARLPARPRPRAPGAREGARRQGQGPAQRGPAGRRAWRGRRGWRRPGRAARRWAWLCRYDGWHSDAAQCRVVFVGGSPWEGVGLSICGGLPGGWAAWAAVRCWHLHPAPGWQPR